VGLKQYVPDLVIFLGKSQTYNEIDDIELKIPLREGLGEWWRFYSTFWLF